MHQSNNNFWKCMLEVAERDLYARAEREREREREKKTQARSLWDGSKVALICGVFSIEKTTRPEDSRHMAE
jgi:hypothetical protein